MYCRRCLCGQSGDVIGQPCKTVGCGGIIENDPRPEEYSDKLPEPMTCGRRSESGMDREDGPFLGAFKSGRGLDYWWKFRAAHGNRVCSYCGSIHPDDLFELVRQSANAPADAEYGQVADILPSDKGYKIYVTQPGVRNASEGGIKFYTHHLPRDENGNLAVTEAQNTEYSKAVQASRARTQRYYKSEAFLHGLGGKTDIS